MNDEAAIATWDLLRDFGFRPDDKVISDVSPGLSFDFGNFKLSASCLMNLSFVEVVLFSGIIATSRSLADVSFELPRLVQSRKQCAAWIVWYLDQNSDGRVFKPVRRAGWIQEGRLNLKLLPWVAEKAAYGSRPQCTVRRDWLRLALKTLDEHLASSVTETPVLFSFDGSVLSIRCDGKIVVLPGEGLQWTVQFRGRRSDLRRPRKRFMNERIDVSIWESRITIGGSTYEGIIEASGGAGTTRIQ